MDGKIESLNPSIKPEINPNLYEVVQIRNNSVVQYYASIEKGGGNRETLKQNLTTPIDDILKEMNKETGKIDFDKWLNEYQYYDGLKKKYYPFQYKDLGTISKSTQKRISKLIETCVNSVFMGYDWKKDYKEQPYITFVTCTLPAKQKHTDKVIKRALTLFLENLVKTYSVKFYLWKAEAQKNGNIHFHVIIDRFIEHQKIRELWNNQMEKLGYIKEYQKNMIEKGFVFNPKSKDSRDIQHLKYIMNKKEGFNNPNSTDIHSLKGIGNVASYMVKYMLKNEENKRPIIGRLWGCSRNIKFLKYPEFVQSCESSQIIELAEKNLKRIDGIDFVLYYKGNIMPVLKRFSIDIFKKIKEYYKFLNRQLYGISENIKGQGFSTNIGGVGINSKKDISGYQKEIQFATNYGLSLG